MRIWRGHLRPVNVAAGKAAVHVKLVIPPAAAPAVALQHVLLRVDRIAFSKLRVRGNAHVQGHMLSLHRDGRVRARSTIRPIRSDFTGLAASVARSTALPFRYRLPILIMPFHLPHSFCPIAALFNNFTLNCTETALQVCPGCDILIRENKSGHPFNSVP